MRNQKHLLKRLTSLAAAVLTCLCCVLPASAARQFADIQQKCLVYDQQGVLTSTELEAANQRIQQTSEAIDMYVAVIIVGPEKHFPSDKAVENYADDAYNELFNPEKGVDTDGALLLINNSTQYDYISTSGAGQFFFTNAEDNDRVWDILGVVGDHLKRYEYFAAVEAYCSQLEYYYHQGIPDNYYIQEPGKGYGVLDDSGKIVYSKFRPVDVMLTLATAAISGFIGLIAAFITYFIVKRFYRFKTSVNPTNYICQNSTHIDESTDIFLREYTSRVRIQSSSGGGHHGGGGRSHSRGGHSHGGGGRHR